MWNIAEASLSELIQKYYVTDEWRPCRIFKFQICSVQCNLTRCTLHYITPRRWIHWFSDWLRQTPHRVATHHSIIVSSLACLTSVRSDRLPSCSLWRRRCSLAPDAICLSYSVDSSALSLIHGEGSSIAIHRTGTCGNLKCTCSQPSFPFVQFKFSVYGLTYAGQ